MFPFNDTICAPATSVGAGAISIVRISGAETLVILDRVVRFRKGDAASAHGYSLKFGTIPDVDDVLVSIFHSPHSYTGEDAAEISCHASPYIVRRILELLVESGARMAEPGEFSRRAFVNGKMDLAQAEAIVDVIASSSEAAHRVAMNQLRGHYSSELRSLRDKLLELTALMELELDFSEEEVEFADRTQLRELLDGATAHIRRLADSFHTGNAIRNGVPVAIVGAVNSGKSTLLNALVGEERAIVSDIAGTTRDTIEEVITLGGIQFRFIDTAGLRETNDEIEKIGVERSLTSIDKADVVIAVLDGTRDCNELKEVLQTIERRLSPAQTFIPVVNKTDVEGARMLQGFEVHGPGLQVSALQDTGLQGASLRDTGLQGAGMQVPAIRDAGLQGAGMQVPAIRISALKGLGLDELRDRLVKSQEGRFKATEGTLVTNLRHYQALVRALESLQAVRLGLDAGIPTDLVSEDLRAAISELNSIFGDASSIDFKSVTDLIFGRFCIGK